MSQKQLDERSHITALAYDKNAKAYEQKFMSFGLYNDTFDEFLKCIAPNARVLELGSGPGNVTRYLLDKSPKLSVLGLDLSPEMVKLASSNVPEARFKAMDVRNLQLDEEFDAVLSAFCIPYMAPEEVNDLIVTLSSKLKSGGYFYLSFMDDDPVKSGFEITSFSNGMPVYIYYHSQEFICDILENHGFEVVFEIQKLYPEPDGSFLTDCILMAIKK